MNRQGPGGQPVRGMPGFPSQQGQPARATSRGGGSQNGWAFGLQNGNGQNMNASQARAGIQSTFAQSIGGGQSQGALDLSDFPSLGGGSHSQFPGGGQAVWSNNQRPSQPGSIQRGPQTQGSNVGSAVGSNDLAQRTLEEAFFSGNNASAGLDDYRHGGQGGLGQLSSSGQTQTGSADDFPPLGRRGHGELGQDRRMNLMQNAVGGGYSAGGPFSGSSGSRVPSGSLRHGPDGGSVGFQNGGNEAAMYSELSTSQAAGLSGRSSTQPESGLGGGANASRTEAANGEGAESSGAEELSDRERYGLKGLLENIRNPDPSNMAIGVDLTNLGLDLNSSEPLYPTFGGPFATGPARALPPEFTLPGCYNVGNVHPLEEKITSVTDETLFWMFYNIVRDVAQELAASELTNRSWRYHKVLRLWITKEPGYADPQPLTAEVERGRYVVFNPDLWRRESREMIIRYADLDDHIAPTVGPTGLS